MYILSEGLVHHCSHILTLFKHCYLANSYPFRVVVVACLKEGSLEGMQTQLLEVSMVTTRPTEPPFDDAASSFSKLSKKWRDLFSVAWVRLDVPLKGQRSGDV